MEFSSFTKEKIKVGLTVLCLPLLGYIAFNLMQYTPANAQDIWHNLTVFCGILTFLLMLFILPYSLNKGGVNLVLWIAYVLALLPLWPWHKINTNWKEWHLPKGNIGNRDTK